MSKVKFLKKVSSGIFKTNNCLIILRTFLRFFTQSRMLRVLKKKKLSEKLSHGQERASPLQSDSTPLFLFV